ncbi:RagB/SusD family nutrient uptake outer membrane protein [Pedobacter gandavensis]|uniref:RagB/SusD family nutrient uptake outer membrane protein n=1 Tax=Pedobacter gandavensis TaxID=2679963 RepID=UPI002931E8C3|nr:RagB/SusD family nutrient uptake outer membrane protein [Pedobacter gandavensis]
MNSYYKISIGVLICLTGLINFSCKKIEDVKSTRLATDETNWKTLEDARANLFSVYGLLRSATVADNGYWLMGDLRKGDFTVTNRADMKAIVRGQLNASYPVINRMTNWRSFYAVINAASLFIERSGEIRQLEQRYTEQNHKVDIAQAKMLRAFAYFYMCRIWGDVPLLTSSHDGEFIKVGRTSQQKVLAFATKELLEAAQVLPFIYGGSDPILPGSYYAGGWDTWHGSLWTRMSAYVILAHIAAWEGNYLDAADYSKFVLDNVSKQVGKGTEDLAFLSMSGLTENSDSSPFAGKRATAIVGFPFDYVNGLSTANGHIEQLTLAAPFIPKVQPEMFVSRDSILKIFTWPTDLRYSIDGASGKYRANYFYDTESERPIFKKIKVINPASAEGKLTYYNSTMVFSRLEEITLLRAEALAVLGQKDQALIELNRATALRGIIFTTANTPDVIKAIFEERRRELMGEGWRWYDLVRLNRIKNSNAVFIEKNGQKLSFKQFEAAGGVYWPVSEEVITANSLITQNPYW